MQPWRLPTILVLVVVLVLITPSAAPAHGNDTPGVFPPNASVGGLTYGEWMARWWAFMLTIPASANPILGASGPTCAVEQVRNVALIAAPSTLGVGVPITCHVPAGAALYVEVLGSECSTLEPPPYNGTNEEELRACAIRFAPHEMSAEIDGVSVQNLSQYIVTSPLYDFTTPDNNIFGVPAGAHGQSVGYEAYLMLAPLSPGQHTIHTHGTYAPTVDFTADRTVVLTVSHRVTFPHISRGMRP